MDITDKVIYVQVWCLRSKCSGCTEMFLHYVQTLETFVRLCRCTKMIWNYIEKAGLVSLHVVFRILVAPLIISGKTT